MSEGGTMRRIGPVRGYLSECVELSWITAQAVPSAGVVGELSGAHWVTNSVK